MSAAPDPKHAARRRLYARACVALLLALTVPALFLVPPPWEALCTAAAAAAGSQCNSSVAIQSWWALCSAAAAAAALSVLARAWRAEDRRAAAAAAAQPGAGARGGRGPKHCAGCGLDVEPQRHMTGGAQTAAIVAPVCILMFGATAALSTIIDSVFWGRAGEFDWFLMLCVVAAAAVPAALYTATPRSCPVCRTRM